ncbi:uncharacterized protein [Spinacia oleracea]|uniref:Reverse transcriptase zinc-binding domain-containing protein n=1 Tax=Spinacia oleracea TaxID=3562 RepID=A0ABM3RSE8_SPIOL|nr:uncharacterized protein LOC130472123 [Spinacia oleracea]
MILNIGSGEDTSLWYHHWVGDSPIYKIPNIRIPDSKAHWRVSHIIKNSTWDLSQINHLLPNYLCNLILATPLSSITTRTDSLRWTLDKSGSFSIKSAYHSSYVPKNMNCTIQICWKKLWKIGVPFKYKMLLWNLCHSILPVADILARKVPGLDPICVRCFESVENHLHLFRDCHSSSTLWSMIFQFQGQSFDLEYNLFYSKNWDEWITYNLSGSSQWKIIFCIAIWHIWSYRNKAVFYSKMGNSSSFYNKFWVDYKCTNNMGQMDKEMQCLKKERRWLVLQ